MRLLDRVLARADSAAIVVVTDGAPERSVSVTWAQLDGLSRAFVAWERTQGVQRGDRVVVVAAHGLEAVVALVAHHRSGVVHVPMNPAYVGEERAHIIDDCGARLVLDAATLARAVAHVDVDSSAAGARDARDGPEAHDGQDRHGRHDEPLRDDDVALIIYTSGTTGKAKGCVLTAANVEGAIDALASLWEIDERDTIVNALPLFHVHGLCVALHAALLKGARTRLLSKFTPAAVVDAFARDGTVFMGVPTMYRRLVDHLQQRHSEGVDVVNDRRMDATTLSRARLFTAGSAALPASDLEAFEQLTHHRIVERYGMSESLITLSNPLRSSSGPNAGALDPSARRAGTVGKPIAGVRMRVVDGELHVSGPGVMREYWNAPDATRATFELDVVAAVADVSVDVDATTGARSGPSTTRWLKTGDLVSVDDDGYVTILGRAATDFVKVGGYKVSTREVEERVADYPGVREVAVVGIPDREWGERIVAVVALAAATPGTTTAAPTVEGLHAHLSAHLAAHKWPRAVVVVDALPRNAMGKVQKKALAQRIERDEAERGAG